MRRRGGPCANVRKWPGNGVANTDAAIAGQWRLEIDAD